MEDSSLGFCRVPISPLRSHPRLFSSLQWRRQRYWVCPSSLLLLLPNQGSSAMTSRKIRKAPGSFSSLVLALTVANRARSRAAIWSSRYLARSCLPQAPSARAPSDAHSHSSEVGMELDQICLFIHVMACLAKTRTHWAAVGGRLDSHPSFLPPCSKDEVWHCLD